ncbi:MAG: hypothetical protein P8P83_00995 [Rickettsiaceae bacterium]|nr:hypothetical protein [Rickettsiaceae bacterium]
MANEYEVIAKDSAYWKIFNNKAKEGVLFTNFAYKAADKTMHALADSLPPNYELLLMTDQVKGLKEASFRCVVFVDKLSKEVVCATAGTRLGVTRKGMDDVMDDLLLSLKKQPLKMNPARRLNNRILNHLGDEAKEYKFTYTGHSLGAAMAEMQAVDMDIQLESKGIKKGKDQITSVTFENPGAKNILKQMYRSAKIADNQIKKRMNICEFNNRKNVINNLDKQAGNTYTIVPHSQTETNPSLLQMVCEVILQKFAEIYPIIAKFINLLLPGGVGTNFVDDHKLSKFHEVFVEKKGDIMRGDKVISLEEAYTGIKPVIYDKKVVDMIRLNRQKNNTSIDKVQVGVPEFSMSEVKKNSKSDELDRIVFSAKEASAAMDQLKTNQKNKNKKHPPSRAKKYFVKRHERLSKNKIPALKEALAPARQR